MADKTINASQREKLLDIWHQAQTKLDTLSLEITHKPHSLRDKLIFLDAENYLKKLEAIFFSQALEGEPLFDALNSLLEEHWQSVSDNALAYTSMPNHFFTQALLDVATLLHEVSPTRSVYQYLMPSITDTLDLFELWPDKPSIDDWSLDQFIVSDDLKTIIPASILCSLSEDDVELKKVYKPYGGSEKKNTPFSKKEKQRLLEHNSEAQKFQHCQKELKHLNNRDKSTGAALQRLIVAMKESGARGSRGGTEAEAHLSFGEDIKYFFNYWRRLDEKTRSKLGSLSCPSDIHKKTLQQVIDILIGKDRKSFSCLNINAGILETILQTHYKILYKKDELLHDRYIVQLKTQLSQAKKTLQNARGNENLAITFKILLKYKLISGFEANMSLLDLFEKICHLSQYQDEDTAAFVSTMLTQNRCQGTLDAKNSEGKTVLMIAIEKKMFNTVLTLLENFRGNDKILSGTDNHGSNVLIKAVMWGNEEILHAVLGDASAPTVQRLLPQQTFGAKHHALSLACQKNQVGFVDSLLRHEAATPQLFNLQNKFGTTAVMWAIEQGNEAMVSRLVEDPNFPVSCLSKRDLDDKNALHLAISVNKVELLELLLKLRNLPDTVLSQKDKWGNNPLHLAIRSKNLALVNCILESDFCTREVLEQGDAGDLDALALAKSLDCPEIDQAISKAKETLPEHRILFP